MSFLKRMVGERKEKPSEPLKRREKTIGNYIIIKTIGEGRYGKVKLAEHIVTRKKVAVKIMKKAQMEAADLARIKRELRVMTVLDHPNIVKLYQVIDTPETTCIVMEFCSGGDLYDYISTYRRLSVPNALKIFRQIVAGLLYCHQHFVIHRDIKPENILLTEDLQVKIGDFGFSRSFNPHAAMETACGSLTYAAPEVIAGKGYLGPKADVWSLGCVLYVLLTGALPFDGANDFEVIPKIRKGKFQDSPFLNEDNMRELITCMLNPDPNKRANLEDIQKHPWTWSDKSMLAMLVRPFSNALSSRRRMALHQGFDWTDSIAMPSPRRERTTKKGHLSREISSISDSELNDPTLPKQNTTQTRARGLSLSSKSSGASNKIDTSKKRTSGEQSKPQPEQKDNRTIPYRTHIDQSPERSPYARPMRDVEFFNYNARSILGDFDDMDLVAMMAEKMDDREMAELERELQLEIEAERASQKTPSAVQEDDRQTDTIALSARASESGSEILGQGRRRRSRGSGRSSASRNSFGSSSSSTSSSSGERSERARGSSASLASGGSSMSVLTSSGTSHIRSGSNESSGSAIARSSPRRDSSPSAQQTTTEGQNGRRRIHSQENDMEHERSKSSGGSVIVNGRTRSRTAASKEEAGHLSGEEGDKRSKKRGFLAKRGSKDEKDYPASPPSSSSSTPPPTFSPPSPGITGRERSQTVGGATKENIMSMLGFRPRTRDQRSQSVFEPPTIDKESDVVVEEVVMTRSRSRSRSMSAADDGTEEETAKKGRWKGSSPKRSPLAYSQPGSPAGESEEEETPVGSPVREARKASGGSSGSIIERYARKKRISQSSQPADGSATVSGGVKPTMLSRLKSIAKKTPKNQQHLVMTRKRSFSTEDAINLSKERIIASREDSEMMRKGKSAEASLHQSLDGTEPSTTLNQQ